MGLFGQKVLCISATALTWTGLLVSSGMINEEIIDSCKLRKIKISLVCNMNEANCSKTIYEISLTGKAYLDRIFF